MQTTRFEPEIRRFNDWRGCSFEGTELCCEADEKADEDVSGNGAGVEGALLR
jgi:hypothetical protein